MKPKIYVLLKAAVKGQLGDKTIMDKSILCNQCNWKKHTYKKIHYVIDAWWGEDLISGINFYLVSKRLKKALEDLNQNSFKTNKIIMSKADYFEVENFYNPGEPLYSKRLPTFYHLDILGRAEGPEVWWKKTSCRYVDKCISPQLTRWDITEAGRNVKRSNFTEIIPRLVYYDSWNGDDMFYLDDGVDPLVT